MYSFSFSFFSFICFSFLGGFLCLHHLWQTGLGKVWGTLGIWLGFGGCVVRIVFFFPSGLENFVYCVMFF
ncbi:hypothetical protein FN846DRAFT_977573 [Sphaerosporella brunnea]|uniref:Uncharacterized protein n=1 Tax=Sphaerosporella brunnea TaxID=1250544 RepID=A0A5J5EFB2_9PEZI|nr:hypothetical protein FN846DRAFT_977573 [Sphaerosporella brunnea]